jgi:hypothetical protein
MHSEFFFNVIVFFDYFRVFLEIKMVNYNVLFSLRAFFPKISRPRNIDVFESNFAKLVKLYYVGINGLLVTIIITNRDPDADIHWDSNYSSNERIFFHKG